MEYLKSSKIRYVSENFKPSRGASSYLPKSSFRKVRIYTYNNKIYIEAISYEQCGHTKSYYQASGNTSQHLATNFADVLLFPHHTRESI